MKRISLTIFCIILTVACYGQTMFFDNFENSMWLSGPNMTDSIIQTSKQIPLGKMKASKGSLRENVTVWSFEAGHGTVIHFDVTQNKENLVSTFKYTTNRDKGILIIDFGDKIQTYKVGFTSTGNNALLIRHKQKKHKSTGT